MDLVAGAMGNLAPKLLQLLQDEYKLQKDVKKQVSSLAKELESMHVALCKVAQAPYDQLDLQVKLWASEAREASYDMEDILDTFLVRVDGCHQPNTADKGIVKRLKKKMGKMFNLSRLKACHDIAGAIEGITKHVDEMAKRRERYKIDDATANSSTTTSIDPRLLMSLRTKASELVGIDEPTDAIIKMLTLADDDASQNEMKIVSVVGSGGLGKTTLAKIVYDKVTVDMNIHCKAFVPVGRNPNLKKVFRDILLDLDKQRYMGMANFVVLDERQLIGEIQAFLNEKRYFIVIDDVWEVASWKTIRIALEDNNNNLGSKLMITTRCIDVAELAHCTYKMKPLGPDNSKILFYGRIFGSQDKCPESFSELSDKILKKCDGVPLAIITIASLLANKESDDVTEWREICNSIGSGLSSSNDMYNDMRKILLLSYYDLPPHIKTCFLYLSMYPEDYTVYRNQLIWRWISEGFIQPQEKSDDLFEIGKSYFNDLVNRSLVEPTIGINDEIYACRVHDMILDLISSISREENFVTTSKDIEHVMPSDSKKLRRLSLRSTTWPRKGVSQVRSIVVFESCIDLKPYFSCLNMLRVLDLQYCSLKDCGGSKMCVGNLIHLRYLAVKRTTLLEGIEKLQFLQVLKIGGFMELPGNVDLPVSIFKLNRLMCLEGVRCCPQPGNLLRNLRSLQVLDRLVVDKDPAGIVEALGHLTQLTKLDIIFIMLGMDDKSIHDALVNSLANLLRLQILWIWCIGKNFTSWEHWAPPPRLRELHANCSQTLPKWISPASLPHLTNLSMDVHTVRPEDIQILGTLPNLVTLELRGDRQNYLKQPLQKFAVSADAFPRVRHCKFEYVMIVPSMITRGAMPRVEDITFTLRPKDFFSQLGGLEFHDLAVDHLPLLRTVSCAICDQADDTVEEEVRRLEEALKRATDVHPNHPKLFTTRRRT